LGNNTRAWGGAKWTRGYPARHLTRKECILKKHLKGGGKVGEKELNTEKGQRSRSSCGVTTIKSDSWRKVLRYQNLRRGRGKGTHKLTSKGRGGRGGVLAQKNFWGVMVF